MASTHSFTLWLVLLLLIALATCVWIVRRMTASARFLPRVGEAASAFELPDHEDRPRRLADFGGRWLVLYFYPRDDTSGCTEQAVQFRDALREFDHLNAVVVGVSVDDAEKHRAFRAKYKLPYTLLADVDGAVARSYGSLLDLGVLKLARRNTFLIDPQGRIAEVFRYANPSRNAREVIDVLRQRQLEAA